MTRVISTELPPGLRRMFDRFRRRWRAVHVQRGLFVTLSLAAGAVGLAVAADRIFRLTETARAVVLGVIAVTFTAALLWLVIRPALRRWRDRDAATRLGEHFPQMQEDLVTAVELSRREDVGVSHSLVVRVLDQIANRAGDRVDPRRAVSLRPVLITGLVLAVVAALLGAGYAARPEAFRNALSRLFRPTSTVPFFSYTNLEVKTTRAAIRTGDSAEVLLTLSGKVPAQARLEDQGRLRLTLPCAGGSARWTSGPLFEDFLFRVSAGDAQSQWQRVRVVPPPSLARRGAKLRDPPYAESFEHAVERLDGPLEVVEGAAVSLLVEPSNRGRDPELVCRGEAEIDGQKLPLAPDGAGCLVTPFFVPKTTTSQCLILLHDGFGLESRAPETVSLKVVPDRVPQVAITLPGRDLVILPGETVAVNFAAQDEFGVRGLALAWRQLRKDETDSRWTALPPKIGGPRVARLEEACQLQAAALGLKPGDILEYRAEAADFAGEPHARRGLSPTFRIAVLSELEHLERVLKQLDAVQKELALLAAKEKALADKAEKISSEAAKAGEVKSGEKPPTAAEARKAEQEQNALHGEVEKVARQVDNMIPELARNPSTPAETMLGLEKLARTARTVGENEMEKASKAFGQASQESQPQQQTPQLDKAGENAAEAARKLAELSRMAEQMKRQSILEQLAAEAERLAARQSELKDESLALAMKIGSLSPEKLNPEQARGLGRLVASQQEQVSGLAGLSHHLIDAEKTLATQNPGDAATAREAGDKVESERLPDLTNELTKQLGQNRLFSSPPQHDQIAAGFKEVAKILRRKSESDTASAIIKQIEEFIRRQTEVNGEISQAIAAPSKSKPARIGDTQSVLARDVADHAGAIRWLAEELEDFKSATAEKLSAASGEMESGANSLYRPDTKEALVHGQKALALLQESREKAKQESSKMNQAGAKAKDMRALLLLQKILSGQRQVNSETRAAEEIRDRQAEAFNKTVTGLAGRQSAVRHDATGLEELLAREKALVERVELAGKKMDLSRVALAGGDTGRETAVVQAEIIALLESLIKEKQCSGSGGGGGGGALGMARLQAMMKMLGAGNGNTPGGNHGGTNDLNVLPAHLGAGDNDWRKIRSQFEGNLAVGAEDQYPAHYREMLNAYFDLLRKEPPR